DCVVGPGEVGLHHSVNPLPPRCGIAHTLRSLQQFRRYPHPEMGRDMPPLADHRHEIVARALAAGRTQFAASKIAGYPDGSSFAPNARKRAQRADIMARKLELEREMFWETDPLDPENFARIAADLIQLANDLPATANDRALAVHISDDL